MMRGGPGLGTIQPSQSDYFQATKGGGHGDYRLIVYGPSTLQELVDLTMEAFDVADRYRNPVMVLGDGVMGQMMEPVSFPSEWEPEVTDKSWATTGMSHHEGRNIVNSLYLDPEECFRHNEHLKEKYRRIAEAETRYELVQTDDADILLVAYGTMARVGLRAISALREKGYRVGLVRPISLWPFPTEAFDEVVPRAKVLLVAEMSTGQMVEDVRLAVSGRAPVHFFGKAGGVIPEYGELVREMEELARSEGVVTHD